MQQSSEKLSLAKKKSDPEAMANLVDQDVAGPLGDQEEANVMAIKLKSGNLNKS